MSTTTKAHTGEPIGYATLENGNLTLNGKTAHVYLKNERILKHGWPDDAFVVFVSGNCLAPEVQHEDVLVIAGEVNLTDGDIVLIEHPKKGPYVQYYHAKDGKQWVSSRHGNMDLIGWEIKGVVILAARYPNEVVIIDGQEYVKIPVVDLKPLPPI